MKMRRRKRVRFPVLAAGGIVIRAGARPRIAIVQRRKDNYWVLPKGKLKTSENPLAAARREASEETGHDVSQHEFLGAISYDVSGKPKIVHFWRMQVTSGPVRKLTRDIRAVEWLPLNQAVDRLTQPLERVFLDHIGQRALALSRTKERRARGAAKRGGAKSRRKASERRARTNKRTAKNGRASAAGKYARKSQTKRKSGQSAAGKGLLRRFLTRLRPAAAASRT